MARIWKGAITFGLVTIPVHLEAAVKPNEGKVSFRQLRERDLSPIRYERVAEKDGEAVAWDQIVKGYEYAKGQFVPFSKEELEAVDVAASRAIDVLDFVPEEEIDPRYFDKPYYVLPEKDGAKAYALLREAIRETGMVGIGKITMRQRQHLVALKVVKNAIVLEMMRFHEEIVDEGQYEFPSADNVRPQELDMAQKLVQNLAGTFDPTKYSDEYQDNLDQLIEAKLKGQPLAIDGPAEPEGTRVIDLMARLQESLERQAKSGKKKKAAGSAPGAGEREGTSDARGSAKKAAVKQPREGKRKRRSA